MSSGNVRVFDASSIQWDIYLHHITSNSDSLDLNIGFFYKVLHCVVDPDQFRQHLVDLASVVDAMRTTVSEDASIVTLPV